MPRKSIVSAEGKGRLLRGKVKTASTDDKTASTDDSFNFNVSVGAFSLWLLTCLCLPLGFQNMQNGVSKYANMEGWFSKYAKIVTESAKSFGGGVLGMAE